MIIRYTLDGSYYTVTGEKAIGFLYMADTVLEQDAFELLAKTGECKFSIFGRHIEIKVIDKG